MFLLVSFDKQIVLWYFFQSLNIIMSIFYIFQLFTIYFENVNVKSISTLFLFLSRKEIVG